ASTTEKLAAFAPIPSASVSAAAAAKPGLLARVRNANRRSWIQERICLLRSKGFDGIEARRPSRRKPAGKDCRAAQDEDHGRIHERVGRAHFDQERANEAGNGESSEESQSQPEGGEGGAIREDEASDVRGLRAERHPHSDFPAAARNRVG